VEQMKVFRKQVSDLENDLQFAREQLADARRAHTEGEQNHMDRTLQLERKLADTREAHSDLEAESAEASRVSQVATMRFRAVEELHADEIAALRSEIVQQQSSHHLEMQISDTNNALQSTDADIATEKLRADAAEISLNACREENRDLKKRCEAAEARLLVPQYHAPNREVEYNLGALGALRRTVKEKTLRFQHREKCLELEVNEKTKYALAMERLTSTLTQELADAKHSVESVLPLIDATSEGQHAHGAGILRQLAQQRLWIAELEKQRDQTTKDLADASAHLHEHERQVHEMELEISRLTEENVGLIESEKDGLKAAPAGHGKGHGKENDTLKRQQKVRAEWALLGRAKRYLASQKKEVRRRQRRIQRDRQDWKNEMRTYSFALERDDKTLRSDSRGRMLSEIKKSLEYDSSELNRAVANLQSVESWLKQREHRVKTLGHTVLGAGFSVDTGDAWSESPLGATKELTSDSGSGVGDNIDAQSMCEDTKGLLAERGHPSLHQTTTSPVLEFKSNALCRAAVAAAVALHEHMLSSREVISRRARFEQVEGQVANLHTNIKTRGSLGKVPLSRTYFHAQGMPDALPTLNLPHDTFQRHVQRWARRQAASREAVVKHTSWLRNFGQGIQSLVDLG
jgi:hypothetical protein